MSALKIHCHNGCSELHDLAVHRFADNPSLAWVKYTYQCIEQLNIRAFREGQIHLLTDGSYVGDEDLFRMEEEGWQLEENLTASAASPTPLAGPGKARSILSWRCQ